MTAGWILARLIVGWKNKKFDLRRELQLLTVYLCIVVICRFVYFPFGLVNGKIASLRFDSEKILPLWVNLVPVVHLFDKYDGWLLNTAGVAIGALLYFGVKRMILTLLHDRRKGNEGCQ